MIPNTELLYRRGLDLKKIIPQALARNFTDIIVINEDRRIPSILCCHKTYLKSRMSKKSMNCMNWFLSVLWKSLNVVSLP